MTLACPLSFYFSSFLFLSPPAGFQDSWLRRSRRWACYHPPPIALPINPSCCLCFGFPLFVEGTPLRLTRNSEISYSCLSGSRRPTYRSISKRTGEPNTHLLSFPTYEEFFYRWFFFLIYFIANIAARIQSLLLLTPPTMFYSRQCLLEFSRRS